MIRERRLVTYLGCYRDAIDRQDQSLLLMGIPSLEPFETIRVHGALVSHFERYLAHTVPFRDIKLLREDIKRCCDKGFVTVSNGRIFREAEGRKITGWNPIHLLYFCEKLMQEWGRFSGFVLGIITSIIAGLLIWLLTN